MDKKYEAIFTEPFWQAADDLGLDRSFVMTKSLEILDDPSIGYDISSSSSAIRSLNFKVEDGRNFRWFYIVDNELNLIVNVFVVTAPSPSKNRGDDAILLARLLDILLRIVIGA